MMSLRWLGLINLPQRHISRRLRQTCYQQRSGCKGRKKLELQFCVTQQRRYYSNMLGTRETYRPPDWASTLSYIPKTRVNLAVTNTPIHPWKVPGVPSDFTVSVKRDDLTGSTLSGNKIRKLEFLLADAVDQGCSHVITCGALQSNHCRAVAVAARQLGLTPHLVLRTDVTDVKCTGCEGNVMLDRLCGSHMYLVPKNSPYQTCLHPRMERLAEHIKSTTGEDSYLIPVGGSNKTGLFGYISVFEELIQQGVMEQFDDLVFPCGSGGTTTGLVVANYLTGGHLRLHGIVVCDNVDYFYNHCDKTLEDVGLGHLKSRDLLRLVDEYKGKGYGVSSDHELEFIQQVMIDTSIVLDPVYTGKAALGMVREMQNNPTAFKGRRVLFIHTGGMLGLFGGQMTQFLEKKGDQQPPITMWPHVDDFPL